MDLQTSLPWTSRPLIINAPMGGIAGADLAIAVSKAGGLGQIGVDNDLEKLQAQLRKVEEALDRTHDGLLPVGVGLLLFIIHSEQALPILKRFKPKVVWLFAAKELEDYAVWTKQIRETLPNSQVWIQVGSVGAALTVSRNAQPDVLCVQGIDAGGHGFERGAGIVSLLPEIADALAVEGLGDIKLVAAGGIANGRSAAAALSLGAEGVVLGTRFLSAPETDVQPRHRAAIIQASDGGQSTVRAKLFDELRGPNIWPIPYDGRSIRIQSYQDFQQGVHIDEIRRRQKEGHAEPAMWAGTGVGLVKAEQKAEQIVNELRAGIVEALGAVKGKL